MRSCYAFSIVLMCVALGCSFERTTLQDINPTRIYKTTVPAFFDEVRLFSIKEGFRLERFEQESGRIIGHRNVSVSSSEAGQLSNAATNKRILMVLKIRPKAERETSVLASFVYGDEQIVLTRSDEDELVNCYTVLFRHLDKNLGPGQIPGPQ
jgi:hypothetical protein